MADKIYPGGIVKVKVTGKDFNQVRPLVETDVTTMHIDIATNGDVDTAVATGTAVWDDDDEGWIYAWDTSAVEPGKYDVRAMATMYDSSLAGPAFLTISLSVPPFVPA